MSELKERMLGQTMNEFGCDTKIYLKSEADKVIEELEKNLSEIQSQKMQLEDDVALLRRNNAELKEMAKEPTKKNNRKHVLYSK